MVFGQELVEPTPRDGHERWVFLHSGDDALPVIYPLRFQVVNAGDKGTSDLIVALTASKIFLASEATKVTASITPAVLKSEIKRGVSTTGELRQVSYALPPLGPKTAAQVIEPLTLTTSYKVPVRGKTTSLDDVDIAWTAEVSYTALITIAAFSSDSPPVTRTLDIMCQPATDASTALAKLKADRTKEMRSYLSGLSRWGRVKAKLGPHRPLTYRILTFSPFEKAGTGTRGGYVAAQEDDAKIALATTRIVGLVFPDT